MRFRPSEFALVFVAETLRRLRSRIFWLATLGGMAGLALMIEAPTLLLSTIRSSSGDLVLAGPASLRARAATLFERRHDFRIVASVDALPQPVTLAYLDAHGRAGAALALSTHANRLHVDVYPRDLSTFDGAQFRALVPLNIELATGLPERTIASALTIATTTHPLDAKFASARTATFGHGIAYGLVFILYLAIILASQSVMSAVAEEKTSRIAEILVATIDPANLLAGKTFAAAATALVQLFFWLATALVLVPQVASTLATPASGAASASSAEAASALAALAPPTLAAFFACFILGYLQYATLYAAAASLISRTEDLGVVTTPVILPVVAAFLVAQFALTAPNAPLVVALGFVPFFSPFVLFIRIAIAEVPAWQIALAFAIDALAVVACFYAAGKIYRVGMLVYGRVPSPRQLLAALRA